jgi:hypothetical protein
MATTTTKKVSGLIFFRIAMAPVLFKRVFIGTCLLCKIQLLWLLRVEGALPMPAMEKLKVLNIWQEREALRGESDVFCRQILRASRFVQCAFNSPFVVVSS